MRVTIGANFFDMEPRLLINHVNEHNKWLSLVNEGEGSSSAQVSIYIKPTDYDRLTRAAEAFNAVMTEKVPAEADANA